MSEDVGPLARKFGQEAIAALVLAIRTGDARTRVAAAQELLSRGFGRPVPAAPVTDPYDGDIAAFCRRLRWDDRVAMIEALGGTPPEPPDGEARE